MTKKKKFAIGVVASIFIFCCGCMGLASLVPDSEDKIEGEPTAVVADSSDATASSDTTANTSDISNEPDNEANSDESSGEIAQLPPTPEETEPPEATPTSVPSDTPEPTSTKPANTKTPRPSPTSTPEITVASVEDPLGNEVVGETAVVTHIVDGDTIDVDINGEIFRLRYIGMDTPERGKPFFQEATDANARMVDGQEVILVKDVSETDRFGRLLRYVYLPDGTFVNGELVSQGYAQTATYPPDVAMQEVLAELQRTAVAAGAGLWTAPVVAIAPTNTAVPIPPTSTPAPQVQPTNPPPTSPPVEPTAPPQPTSPPPPAVPGPVVIVGVNKRDEYVDIQNQGGADVDLSGWVLVSEKGNQACGLSGGIGAGQTLRIWAMSEDSGQGGFNCGFGSNIWNNNDPDPAVLYDSTGAEVSRR